MLRRRRTHAVLQLDAVEDQFTDAVIDVVSAELLHTFGALIETYSVYGLSRTSTS